MLIRELNKIKQSVWKKARNNYNKLADVLLLLAKEWMAHQKNLLQSYYKLNTMYNDIGVGGGEEVGGGKAWQRIGLLI